MSFLVNMLNINNLTPPLYAMVGAVVSDILLNNIHIL